ncbi:hypothetical protein E9993_11595 [Labilibacter sediminis]|nr:hypothetical protein E9993_11595 [Labilibacter sediminis]
MKGLSITVILTFCISICINLNAQNDTIHTDTIFDGHVVSSDWIDHGIVIGIDFSKNLYGEIDYYRSYIWEAGGFPTLSTTMNYGAEFSYFDKFVLAPKIQGRIHAYFFNASLAAICYSDFKKDYAIKLRPEIGIGLWNIDINYGYNIDIYKNGFDQYNRHVVTLRYYLKLHRKHLNEYDRNGNKRPEN